MSIQMIDILKIDFIFHEFSQTGIIEKKNIAFFANLLNR